MSKFSYVCDVAIEVTRRCNMKCSHCLRGDAQDMDISKETIDRFLDGFIPGSYIGNLTITGGEISLNVKMVKYLLRAIKNRRIDVGNFYMVTNGKNIVNIKALVSASLEWYGYCLENEFSGITISKDPFHETIRDLEKSTRYMSALSYFRPDDKTIKELSVLLDEGRAKTLSGYKKRPLTIAAPDICQTDDGVAVEEGMIYLSCNGNVLPDCDMSYDHADKAAASNVYDQDWVKEYESGYTWDSPLIKECREAYREQRRLQMCG